MSINNLFSLEGRTAMVTGASSGIGAEVAKGLAQAGARVVVAARREDRLQQLVADIEAAGGNALAVAMDVTDRDSVNAAFAKAQDAMGVVDVLINNAGVADTKGFLKIDDESLDFVMGTNFGGVWNVAQEATARMVEAGKPGAIVNISSVLGLAAKPGYTSYCASKGAVIQLTRAMALDLGKAGIRVNAIAPGWFRTEINESYFDSEPGQAYIKQMPARRLGQLPELVGPILMLCSEAGSFVNGAVIPVDGAHSAAGI
ncbi:SDR family NAD(P)-dependent oxidoreductase [Candidatus Pelagadaptatus aseana]|uniref:SDR family NAD(P)-dependent oxidoreductase n=1 Tax=Candidatus Pelagadaptatus aseana TaxID=3120508 RepID=UPI003C6F4472